MCSSPKDTPDLSNESAEVLETSGLLLRKQRVATLAISLLFVLIMLGLGLFFLFGTSASLRWAWPDRQPSSPTVVSFGFLGVISIFASLASGILSLHRFFKIPFSPLQPHKACLQFYMPCLISGDQGLTPTDYTQAYVCLLGVAKQAFESFKSFEKYWRHVRGEIARACKNYQGCTLSIKETSRSERAATFEIRCNVRDGKHIRSFADQVQLVCIGSRWYLTRGQWQGREMSESQEDGQ